MPSIEDGIKYLEHHKWRCYDRRANTDINPMSIKSPFSMDADWPTNISVGHIMSVFGVTAEEARQIVYTYLTSDFYKEIKDHWNKKREKVKTKVSLSNDDPKMKKPKPKRRAQKRK